MHAETLDLLLFSGQNSFFSEAIEVATRSKFSHVGLVLHRPIFIDPSLTGVYLWESGSEPVADPETGSYRIGVRLTELKWLYQHYDGEIYHRRFTGKIAKSQVVAKLRELYLRTKDSPYDINPIDFARCLFHLRIGNCRQEKTFFCSALCGYILSHLGILPTETEWDLLQPKEFENNLTESYGEITRIK